MDVVCRMWDEGMDSQTHAPDQPTCQLINSCRACRDNYFLPFLFHLFQIQALLLTACPLSSLTALLVGALLALGALGRSAVTYVHPFVSLSEFLLPSSRY